jgi:hypothetical protein
MPLVPPQSPTGKAHDDILVHTSLGTHNPALPRLTSIIANGSRPHRHPDPIVWHLNASYTIKAYPSPQPNHRYTTITRLNNTSPTYTLYSLTLHPRPKHHANLKGISIAPTTPTPSHRPYITGMTLSPNQINKRHN